MLICPLDWGLGHASRDVFIIKRLINSGFKVILGADKAPLSFLRTEFPELPFIKIPSIEIKYSKGKLMVFKILFSTPKLFYGIFREHRLLKKIIASHAVDIVISDNRFGLWNKKLYSIFITHQLEIQTSGWMRLFKGLVNKINRWFINKYDLCWIPDLPGENNLGGELSHPKNLPANSCYIGLLSRFKRVKYQEKKYKILVILSGPEPQRSIFEEILIKELKKDNLKVIIVCGKPGISANYSENNIDFVNHLETDQLAQLIISTPIVISRSGYSSIMDYIKLNKKAILVATPGQTEQEYLAKNLKKRGLFYSVDQQKFNLKESLEQFKNYQSPNVNNNDNKLLENEIRNLQLLEIPLKK